MSHVRANTEGNALDLFVYALAMLALVGATVSLMPDPGQGPVFAALGGLLPQRGVLVSTHSSRGSEWERLRRAVLARDRVCVYCKTRQATQADHVTPKSQGGADSLDNLVGSCATCNQRKGDRTLTRQTWTDPSWLGT